MSRLILFGGVATVLAIGLCQAQNEKDKKARGVIVYRVDAVALAKEFKTDSSRATKKYNPKPPRRGAAGGAILMVTGVIEKVKGKDVFLKTGAGVSVVLRAKSIKGQRGGAKIATATGKFKEYRNRTVIVECTEVMLRQIIGKKK